MRLDNIKTLSWFGSSWVCGTELEKTSDSLAIDQNTYVIANRFSNLVSQNFNCLENNRSIQGISAENLSRQIVLYVNSKEFDVHTDLLMIIWPSNTKYFWIDDQAQVQDIRINSHSWWYRNVDNVFFRQYCMQRTIWSLYNFLTLQGVKYFFLNGEESLLSKNIAPEFSNLLLADWLLDSQEHIANWLGVNLDQGYPPLSVKHDFFWPCENHPNLAGHHKIAKEIVKLLQSTN
jgi:hypothetical protein